LGPQHEPDGLRELSSTLQAIEAELGLGSYAQWPEDERLRFLLDELSSKRPLIPHDLPASNEVREVLDTFAMLSSLPRDSLGAYVISMAHQPSDVLAVELLQKEAGIGQPLRVVPLFETIRDLRASQHVVTSLLDLPWYRDRIQDRLDEVEQRLLQVLDQEVLLEHSPTLRRSLELRRAYLDPINLIQAELLRRQRLTEDEDLQDALLATVNGIAAGLKNTG
jgi:phosphoenolpyruvate carboxylase